MEKSIVNNLRGHLILWFAVQLIVSALISHDMLDNYARWEEDLHLKNELQNQSVYAIAMFSSMITVVSAAFFNLSVVMLMVHLGYKIQSRWCTTSLDQNNYTNGTQFILYALIFSDVIKYFCVLIGEFSFNEWETFRFQINFWCLILGCVSTVLIWIKNHIQFGKASVNSILTSAATLFLGLAALSAL